MAHTLHPGAVDTNFFSYALADTRERAKSLDKITEEDGVNALTWLATAPEGGRDSGAYWHRRRPRTPNPLVEDDALVERFWAASERLADRP